MEWIPLRGGDNTIYATKLAKLRDVKPELSADPLIISYFFQVWQLTLVSP